MGGARGRQEAAVAGSGRQCAGCAVVLPAATTVQSALRLKSAFSVSTQIEKRLLFAHLYHTWLLAPLVMRAKRRRLQILAAHRPIAHV